MMHKTIGVLALTVGLVESACVMPAGDIGDLPGSSGTEGDGSTEQPPGDSGSVGDEMGEDSGGSDDDLPSHCGPDGPTCVADEDRDCVTLSEDNDPSVYNPSQSDLDADGFVDEIDRCATVAGATNNADSDDDGVGNECDPCRRDTSFYNYDEVSVPGYMRVRNVPSVADFDGDGIGDVCDNCVVVANCDGYDSESPWEPGDPISDDNSELCQLDGNNDMVGDSCLGLELEGAAGPVGLGPDDDFDQDGLTNVVDACPRQPLSDAVACTGDVDCPDGRACEIAMGVCDHLDHDADGVGDLCDTCPTIENPLQVADGAAQDADDIDGDFIGNACESSPECEVRQAPRRTGFYPVSVGGQCCTVGYRGDGSILDPDGLPVMLECSPADEGLTCRALPAAALATPGLVALPPGCDTALADAGLTVETHLPLQPADVGGLPQLWGSACTLPPLDQDFDGLVDDCDLCRFAFDPENLPFIDEGGQVFPDDGRYCNGAYNLDNCL